MIVIVPILFPILAGLLLLKMNIKDRKDRNHYVFFSAVINTIISIIVIFFSRNMKFVLVSFSSELELAFNIDGLSFVFALIVSCLWVPATAYALEYMKHEGHENTFFSFFTMTYGVVLGVAFAGNLITMYLFYELLTMTTLPLVMHGGSPKAMSAGKKYLTFSIAGASFGFIAMMVLLYERVPFSFVYGGGAVLENLPYPNLIYTAYIIAFFGFGVKAGVFPFHVWLPAAGVAPTPVTALLHAVAVVNAGVFAVIRMTYYSFGADFLRGSYAQIITMIFAVIGIVFGSAMALRSLHLKRRLAFSTISNLSYMLFSVTLLNETGLLGAVAHMTFHSVLKITLFFVAGAVLYISGREYVTDVRGLGKRMPIAFVCFAICSLGLMGIPPLIGFTSKWIIGSAAAASENIIAYLGVFALIISALLTCIYLFTVITPAFFPREGFDESDLQGVKDPGPLMTVPIVLMTVVSLVMVIFTDKIIAFFEMISRGGVF